mgnify:CR=1 FL=1
MVFLAVLPLLWLIVALSILKVPAWKACGVAAIISFIVAVVPFGKELASWQQARWKALLAICLFVSYYVGYFHV